MNIVLILYFDIHAFFSFGSPLHRFPIGFWVILKQPSFITGNHTAYKVWIFFDFLQNEKSEFSFISVLFFQNFSTILGQTFLIFRFRDIICDTASLSIINSAVILMVT
jgi:hypothetical protein